MEERHITIEETIQSITKDGRVVQPFSTCCSIYRVHERLREVKREAYEPMVVSIGPYHLQNEKLKAMKNQKLWYLHSLHERINKRLEMYILELEKLEERIRKCYDEPIDLDSKKFVEMMLLDSCFIIEFIREKTVNPKLTVGWMKNRILEDMMLLENQIPFFLLSKLYDMTKEEDENPLMSLIVDFFKPMIGLPNVNFGCFDHPGIQHLLHLVHALCCPSPISRAGISERSIKKKIKDFVLCPVHFLSKLLLEWSQNQDDIPSQMHSAVELQEAGVEFKKDETANLFVITFEDGLMKLPCLCIDDLTDTFFRNLIAFEQHYEDIVPKYFTEFSDFMDQLISSERDVKLLRHKGIIDNYLGDDKEVSNLFNKLGDGVIVPETNSCYSEVLTNAKKHCKKTWNEMRAKLMHDYFNSPWATVSTIAAAMLLILTLLQTIASVKTL